MERNMPKRKKSQNFLEDIGSFEFDDVHLSRSGRLVEENKRVELDFSGFLRVQAEDQVKEVNEPEKKLTQNQATSSVNAYDDVDSLADFEDQESDKELENLSVHNRRKLRLLSSWRTERNTMLLAYMKSCCIPETATCKVCSAEHPEFRCHDCGPHSYFCMQCLVDVHYMANHFHSPEKWQV